MTIMTTTMTTIPLKFSRNDWKKDLMLHRICRRWYRMNESLYWNYLYGKLIAEGVLGLEVISARMF